MNTAYVDTSVFLRIVLGQPDQLREWGSFTPASSVLSEVESMRAIARAQLEGELTRQQAQAAREQAKELLRSFDLVEIDAAILERAAAPFGTHLRALDALHLATALFWARMGGEMALATHDRKHFAPTARALGFQVIGAPLHSQR